MASASRPAPALRIDRLGDHWAHLRDGTFVVIDKETDQSPFVHDRDRELRLWEAIAHFLEKAALAAT